MYSHDMAGVTMLYIGIEATRFIVTFKKTRGNGESELLKLVTSIPTDSSCLLFKFNLLIMVI